MVRKFDITEGDIFGDFVISKEIKRNSRKYGRYVYKVKCRKCPFEKTIESHHLKKLKPCQFCHIYENIGKRHGKLTFIEYKGRSLFKAYCDCGNYCEVRLKSSSCGCDYREKRPCSYKKREENFKPTDFIGIKFSYLTIKKYLGLTKNGRLYEAKCKCGNLTKILKRQFYYKKSCGCLQKESVPRGSRTHNSKFSEIEVASMKELYLSGQYSKEELMDVFKICKSSLTRILRGYCWKHIKVDKSLFLNASEKIKAELSAVKNFKRWDYESLIGKRFGSRIFLEIYPGKIKGLFLCDCGKKSILNVNPILTGKSKSCFKCAMKKKDRNYLIGKKFGNQTILEITENCRNKLKGVVKCDCGNEREILLHHIMRESMKGCPKCYSKFQLEGHIL